MKIYLMNRKIKFYTLAGPYPINVFDAPLSRSQKATFEGEKNVQKTLVMATKEKRADLKP